MLKHHRVDEGRDVSAKMLGQHLITRQTPPEGLPVDKVYVVEHLNIGHEYYLAVARRTGPTPAQCLSCPKAVVLVSRSQRPKTQEL